MIKQKKQKDDLLKFWEMQLNIDYAVEFEYYKKLCGNKYDPQIVSKKYNSSEKYVSYKEWKKGIKEQIKKLDREQLKEYSRYLEQKARYYDTKINLIQVAFIPLVIWFIGCFVEKCLVFNVGELFINGIDIFLNLIFIVGLFIYLNIVLLPLDDDSIHKYFYQDMKEIVDKRIKKLSKPQKEREQR